VLCDEIFYLDKGKVIQHSVKESVNADE